MSATKRPRMMTGQLQSGAEFYYYRKPSTRKRAARPARVTTKTKTGARKAKSEA